MADRPEENLKLDIEVAQKVMGWYHEDEAKWPDMEAWWFDNPKFEGAPKYLPRFSVHHTPAHLVLDRIDKLGLEWVFSMWLLGLMIENPVWAERGLSQGARTHVLPGAAPFKILTVSPELICKAALKAVEYREKATNA